MGNLNLIMKSVCTYFNITPVELFKKSRQRAVVEKRMIFFYLSTKLTNLSLNEIGLFSKIHASNTWDHSSVLHSRNTIKNLMNYQKGTKQIVEDIEKLIRIKDVENEFELPEIKQNIMRLTIDAFSRQDLKKSITKYLEVI